MKLRKVPEDEFLSKAEHIDWFMYTHKDGKYYAVEPEVVKERYKKHVLYDRFGTWIMTIDEARWIEGDAE